MSRYFQRFFIPKNPQKYVGKITEIFARSSWEIIFMKYLDETPGILKWSSESIIIPYFYHIDGKMHRYFVDFYFEARSSDKSIHKYLIEIKPHSQTNPPVAPKNKNQKALARFVEEHKTWEKNKAKWSAAREYSKKNGIEFKIITEKHLNINPSLTAAMRK